MDDRYQIVRRAHARRTEQWLREQLRLLAGMMILMLISGTGIVLMTMF